MENRYAPEWSARKIPCSELVRRIRDGEYSPLIGSRDYFFRLAADLRGLAAAFASATGAGGLSPITPLSGQILKAGHFWQPATMAMGQMVMALPIGRLRPRSMPAAAAV